MGENVGGYGTDGQVFKSERRFTIVATGEMQIEIQYGRSLTRKKANPVRLVYIVCSEWGIENGASYGDYQRFGGDVAEQPGLLKPCTSSQCFACQGASADFRTLRKA